MQRRKNARQEARLHVEQLEARLVLSSQSISAYDLPRDAWFGAPTLGTPPLDVAAGDQNAAHEWIIRLTGDAAAAAGGVGGSRGVLGDLGFRYEIKSGLGLPGQLLIQTWDVDDAQVRSAWAAHPAVAYAGLNETIAGAALHPNDPAYTQGRQFGLDLKPASGLDTGSIDSDIDAPEAWQTTTGSSSVVVAVLDSGVDYNHEDLVGNIWSDGLGGHGYDFYSMDADPMDENGHGTHVAGIIGAQGNNSIGVVGVNWDVSLMPIRVLGPGNTGTVAQAIQGIAYAVNLATRETNPVAVRVINASWAVAGQFVDQSTKVALAEAIEAAGLANILVVAAAGNGDILNNGVDLNSKSYLPATIERDQAVEFDNLVVVAASDPYDRLAYFSNYGAGIVDLAAPGDDILSTLPGSAYGYRDGTSMAAPHVAGAAALVLAHQPDLTAGEVRQALLNTVDQLATPEDRARVASGGRLNAARAVEYTAFAPRSALVSAADVVSPNTPGAGTHSITIRYTGKTAIDTTSLGLNDIKVRHEASGETLTLVGVSYAVVGSDPKVVDATYAIAGPGDGVWNGQDNGDYQVEVLAGAVLDSPLPGRPAEGTKYALFADAFSVNITQGVFRVERTDDVVDSNPGNGLPNIAGPGTGFTLRGALQEANLVPGSTIILTPGVYQLSLAGAAENASLTGDLDVTGSVTIASDGAGEVIIDGHDLDRVFDVRPGATLRLEGITVRNGSHQLEDGGGVRNQGTLTLKRSSVRDSFTGRNGGGVYNAGVLSVIESTIAGNIAATNGGGLFNAAAAQADVQSSTISHNAATGETVFAFTESAPLFRASTTTGGARRDPHVAINSLGEAVIVWTSDTGAQNVFGQKINAAGAKDGPQFQLNTAFPDPVQMPDVVLYDDGNFGTLFETNFDVGFRDFNWNAGNDPTPTTASTVPVTSIVGSQYRGRITQVDGGNFLLVWTDEAHNDGEGIGVMGSIVTRNGVVGAPFPLTGAGQQRLSGIARWPTGEIIVGYQQQRPDGSWDVYAQRLTSAGALLGAAIKLNATPVGALPYPTLTVTENGFAAAWYGTSVGVRARLFNKTGVPQTAEIPISPLAHTGLHFSIASATLPDDSVVVVWGDVVQPGANINGLYMQRVSVDGSLLGEAKTIATTAAFAGAGPAVAVNDAGVGYVVWDGAGPGDSSGVVAQQFTFVTEPTGLGAGVYNAGILNANNATISTNTAEDSGGGVYNAATGSATLRHATVTKNEAPTAAGVFSAAGGSVVLKNSIVAGNSTTAVPDLAGVFSSQSSGNLVGNLGAATGLVHNVDGNQVGSSGSPINPQLGALSDNGGLTLTHAPNIGSPAIDAGTAGNGLAVDQRGVARPVDGDGNGSLNFDVGAVENFYAAIRGKKFNDRNGNGLEDSGEEGLAGWTIYIDVNLNGQLDATEPYTITRADDPATPAANETGEYAFIGLSPGLKRIAEVSQAGWERTYVSPAWVQERIDDVGGVDGLSGVRTIAATSNNQYVYAAGAGEDKIARFSRNSATGQLTYLGSTTAPGQLVTPGGPNILEGVEQIASSQFGANHYLYVLSAHGALSVFNVNAATGDLALALVFRDGQSIGVPATTLHLAGAAGLAASADGQRVYVSNNDASLIDSDYLLIFERTVSSFVFRSQKVTSPTFQAIGGRGVAVSPDNQFVYVAGATDNDAIDSVAVLKLGTSGQGYLVFQSIVRNNQPDASGNLVHGLDGAYGVVVSPDGLHLYVTGSTDNSVAVFERNLSTGELKFVQELTEGTVDYLGNTALGLNGASAIAVDSDGSRVYVSGKIINNADPFNPIVVGGVAVFRRDALSGRLTYHEFVLDNAKDDYGINYEYADSVASIIAPDKNFIYVASTDESALTTLRRDTRGRDDLLLAVGETRLNVNFANRALPGAVFGKIYDNRNGDADQDVDEPSLSGWQVYLDLNNNGIRDSSGAGEPVTTTDATGVFAFTTAPIGAPFTVRPIMKAGWTATAPAAAPAGAYPITLQPGETVLRKDIGVTLQSAIGSGTGSFAGVVFQDVDGNGQQAGFGEPGLGGLRVYLDLDQDGVFDATEPNVFSNSNLAFGPIGTYTISGVPDTPFVIRVAGLAVGQQLVAPIGNSLNEQSYSLGVSTNPTQVASADFDLDNDLDLAVLTLDGVVSIFRNNGSGQFSGAPVLLPAFIGATSMTVGDFNADGRPDLALASSTISKVAVAMNNPSAPPGTLAFTAYATLTTTLANWDVVAADFSGDGRADLALAQRSAILTNASQVLVLHSTTTSLTPTFSLAQTVSVGRQPRSIQAAQIDDAGGLDLVLVNQFDRTVQILLKSGSSFAAQSPIAIQTGSDVDAPFTVRTGNLNGDTKLDLVVGNSNTTAVSVLLSGPTGYLPLGTKPLDAKGLPRDIAVADIDADGDRDIVVGTVGPAGITILRNAGTAAAPSFQQPEVKGVANLQTSDLPGVKSLVTGDFAKNGGPLEIAAVSGSIDSGSLVVFSNATTSGAYRVAATSGANLVGLNFALTSPASFGDYDANQSVDGRDFLVWQRQFGGPASPAGSGADGDPDGVVDGDDLAVWRANFGTVGSTQQGLSAASAGASSSLRAPAVSTSIATTIAATDVAALQASPALSVSALPRDLALERAAGLQEILARPSYASRPQTAWSQSAQRRDAAGGDHEASGDEELQPTWRELDDYFASSEAAF